MEPEVRSQREKLSESVNWPEVLDELWKKGKTASNLSKKGVSMEIGGETFNVRHNRRGEDAFLRLESADDPAKKIFVILRNAYFVSGRKEQYARPRVTSAPRVACELHGHMNKDSDFVGELTGDVDAEEVHEVLQALGKICDVTADIKRFRLNWGGDLMQLLPHSLLDQLYEMVRVSPEGQLVLNNYKALVNNGKTVEQYERESGVGIQKAINLREGIVTEQDAEDIEVYITDDRIRKHIKEVMKKTNMSPHHPLFQQLYDFYCSILLQVKSTRDRLQHLVPVQPNEPLRVRIGSDALDGHAYFETGATKRGKKRFLGLEEKHHHAYMTYPPNRYNEFDPQNPVNLEIHPVSIQAETRHHVHYMNLDALNRELPNGIQGNGITEMVDDMQFFPKEYDGTKKLHSLLGGPPPRTVDRNSAKWWSVMVLLDSGHIPGLNGHIFTGHVLHSLAVKFCKRRKPLTLEEFELIDKVVFDFLSDIEGKEASIDYLSRSVKRIKRLQVLNSPETFFDNEMRMLRTVLNVLPETPVDIEYLHKMLVRYEAYKKKLQELAHIYNKGKGHPLALHILYQIFREIEEDRKVLGEFMVKYLPFRAPDGKNYPTPAAYYLNPEVLYEEIVKRYPQLGL